MNLIEYYKWLKTNWAQTGVILFIYSTLFISIFTAKRDFTLFLLLMNFPTYLIHQTEEYIFPGGFQKFFNLNIFKSGKEEEPMGETFIFYVDILLIWVLLPLFGLLSMIDYTFGLWMPYFSFFAGFAHIILGVVGRKLYNPGLIASCLVNIPFGCVSVWYLTKEGLYSHPILNYHILIGFGLNAMMPVLGVILKKTYNKKQALLNKVDQQPIVAE